MDGSEVWAGFRTWERLCLETQMGPDLTHQPVKGDGDASLPSLATAHMGQHTIAELKFRESVWSLAA